MAAVKLAVKVAELEKQISMLADELAEIKKQVANGHTPEEEMPWWEKRWGLFDNDPDYEMAMKLGREYRESLRPKPVKKRKQTAKKAAAKKTAKALAR
jgi:hypothetical protein